jgi:predicted nicotinamide N-methyase
VAARLGAFAIAIDIHPDVSAFIEENLARNGLADRVQFRRADWESFRSPRPFDLILGSDILYENQHPQAIAKFLDRNLMASGTAVIVDPCRWHHQEFDQTLRSAGFDVAGTYCTVDEGGKITRMYTMIITRRIPTNG